MKYTIEGEVESVGEVQQISEKFKKADFALIVPDGKYPQLIPFQLTGQNTSIIDTLKAGDFVEVSFNLRGRRANNGKVYGSNDAWLVKVLKKGAVKVEPSLDAPDDSDVPF